MVDWTWEWERDGWMEAAGHPDGPGDGQAAKDLAFNYSRLVRQRKGWLSLNVCPFDPPSVLEVPLRVSSSPPLQPAPVRLPDEERDGGVRGAVRGPAGVRRRRRPPAPLRPQLPPPSLVQHPWLAPSFPVQS